MSPRSPARGRRNLARMLPRAATLLAVGNTVALGGRFARSRLRFALARIARAPPHGPRSSSPIRRAGVDPSIRITARSPSPADVHSSTPPTHDACFEGMPSSVSFLSQLSSLCSFRRLAGLQVLPQRHQQLPGQRHDPDLALPRVARSEPLQVPLAQRALRAGTAASTTPVAPSSTAPDDSPPC